MGLDKAFNIMVSFIFVIMPQVFFIFTFPDMNIRYVAASAIFACLPPEQ